ncbi:hypothetical protein PhaR5_135 [Acinetobacter phage PhaR5]|nr:hypothetical protein PhaR5_135 [Acinetobacter phage PhaR5]
MIDFKELLKKPPRFTKVEEVAHIIEAMETLLARDITERPDADSWQRTHSATSMTESALKEMYEFISCEYVAMGRTQMQVGFEPEQEIGRDWFPAKITFTVSRSMLTQ